MKASDSLNQAHMAISTTWPTYPDNIGHVASESTEANQLYMHPTTRNCKDHTPAEWEEVRPRFTELYLTGRKRLADVSRILRHERGFHATDKQYKDRIRKWRLKKNFKDDEKREALATGFSTESGDHVVLHGAPIPQHRLRRFARNEKLLFVRKMAAGVTLPPEPQADFDIIIELPRYIFTTNGRHDASSVHAALAAIDRLTQRRTPILAFEVLGVSDSLVRYGLRRLERKTQPGLAVELLAAPCTTVKREGLAIQFCASFCAAKTRHETKAEDEDHVELYHKFNHRVYQACQEAYAPETRVHHATLGEPGQPPDLHCVKFNGSAFSAQCLYLRLLTHCGLAGAMRYIEQCRDVELLCSPGGTLALRLDTSYQDRSFIFTMYPALNVAMHAVKRGDIVAGVFQFRPGLESTLVTSAGIMEQEVSKLRATLNAERNRPIASSASGQFLTEGNPVEAEFEEASRRAATQVPIQGRLTKRVAIAEMKPLTGREPMSAPRRQYSKLISEECMVDRKEPWRLRKTPS